MKLVMFDMDGTLTDSFSLDENCYLLAIEQALGLPPVDLDWESITHASSAFWLQEITRRARGTAPTAEEARSVQLRLIAVMDEVTARTGRCTREIPGAAACLRWLREHGYAIAIASGDWELTARHKLSRASIPCEQVPAAFCDLCHPRIEIMQTALARATRHYGCAEFEQIIYVGDGVWDARACRELGWPLIGVGTGAPAAQLRALGVSPVIANYQPIDGFIHALEQAVPPGSRIRSLV
ncbi:HAD family hydrolase [Opitutus terrae]|uniref:Haloacid dehalogenase domain protein hydrolase n=1 Tax=Opitutus terrae (strain DSM 11246 / JCM 15787 / PB90-1) TaxID=452637 RepID=B1ZS94_OPITP|nr:HAD family hydrolase [Opitutus terrae]ACB75693.1 Haloacid dehalogenase domain protein hydrolase [Opitutus terrae PB90-1]